MEQNKELEVKLAQANTALEEQKSAAKSNTAKLKETRDEISKTKENLVKLERQEMAVNSALQQIDREMKQNHRQIETLKSTIAKNEHNEKVNTLFKQQKEFWSALLERLIHQQHELNSDLVGFGEEKNPRDVIKKLKDWAEGNGMSDDLVKLRNFCGFYNEAIKKLCEAKVKGEYVSADMKAQPKQILDRCLFSKIVEPFWNS